MIRNVCHIEHNGNWCTYPKWWVDKKIVIKSLSFFFFGSVKKIIILNKGQPVR